MFGKLAFRYFTSCLSMFLSFLILSACDEAKDLSVWIENVNKLREVAKIQGEIIPYREEQFQAIKNYFSEIGQKALTLSSDAKSLEKFNAAIAGADFTSICTKIFLSRQEWASIMERCIRNRFFLCAEEVRAYPEMITSIRKSLSAENLKKFDRSTCQAFFQ